MQLLFSFVIVTLLTARYTRGYFEFINYIYTCERRNEKEKNSSSCE